MSAEASQEPQQAVIGDATWLLTPRGNAVTRVYLLADAAAEIAQAATAAVR